MPYVNQSPVKLTLAQRILPYLLLGIMLTVAVGLMTLFSVLAVIGAIIGLCLYAVYAIRQRFWPAKSRFTSDKKPRQGRIIEHDDL
jgi:Ca2+/Na+ antiporter